MSLLYVKLTVHIIQKNVSPTAPPAPSPYENMQVREAPVGLPHKSEAEKKKTPLKKPTPAARKSKELVKFANHCTSK